MKTWFVLGLMVGGALLALPPVEAEETASAYLNATNTRCPCSLVMSI